MIRVWRKHPGGDGRDWEALLRRCCAAFHPDNQREDAYRELARALGDNPLSRFDGRGNAADWLALQAANLLGVRLTRLFGLDARSAWSAFEHYFGPELVRLVARRCSTARLALGIDAVDVHQEVRLRLAARDYMALRRYDGRGSYHGYLRRVARNAIEDVIRAIEGRPSASRGSGPVAQADPRPRHISIEDSGSLLALVDPRGTPEERAAAAETAAQRESAIDALEIAMQELPEVARQYLWLRFLADPPLPPRRIAAELGFTVEALYRARPLWGRLLRDALRRLGVEEFPPASV